MDDKIAGRYHWVTGGGVAYFAFWSYYKACMTDPGKITKNNVR